MRAYDVVPYSSERYRKLIESPQFKRWFGQSKVVDETGLPLLVYRGERKKWIEMPTGGHERLLQDMKEAGLNPASPNYRFEVEHSERLGDVAWFTDDEGIAWGYMDGSSGGEVMMCFLSFQNPLDLRVATLGPEGAIKLLNRIVGGEDEFADTNLYGSHAHQMANKIVYDNSVVIDWARHNGYDSVIHDDHCIQGKYGHVSYVAFHPYQIKSFSNRGTFKQSKNIYEAVAHYETSAEMLNAAERICVMVKAKSKRMPIRVELRPDIRHGYCHGIMVTDLYADEPGNGAGSELMNFLFRLADEAGLNVSLNAEGPRSHRFYTKLGMEKDSSGYHHLVKYAELGPEYDYLKESAEGPTYYHVTFNDRLPKIRKEGLRTGRNRIWNTGFGDKYGDTKTVYLFTQQAAAVRWAHKMEWEFKKPATILLLKNIPHDIEEDPSLEQQLAGQSGVWKRVRGNIPPECIVGEVPMTVDLARALVKVPYGSEADFKPF
jgi:hypothetical protein